MIDELLKRFDAFAMDCNRDSSYANSWEAGNVMSALAQKWRESCPGLEVPSVLCQSNGRYVVAGVGVRLVPVSGEDKLIV